MLEGNPNYLFLSDWKKHFIITSYNYTKIFSSVLWQHGPLLQAQNTVHDSHCALHPQHLLSHDIELLHPHFWIRTSTEGARTTPSATMAGLNVVEFSLRENPKSTGSKVGGADSRALYQTASWRWALRTFSLNDSFVGGSEHSCRNGIPSLKILDLEVLHLIIG